MGNIKNRGAADTSAADRALLEIMPKTVIYAIAKHLAAVQDAKGYDRSLEIGSYIRVIRQEWENLHHAGIVPQKPPRD